MVHCTIAAIKWKNEGEWDWVGSGWVASGERRSLLDSTQASLFFRSAATIVPWLSCRLLCTSFYNMNSSNRLCFHSISCQKKKMIIIMKLWCRIQVTTTNIFLESVVEPLITKKESRVRQNKCNHLSYK